LTSEDEGTTFLKIVGKHPVSHPLGLNPFFAFCIK